MHAHAPLHRHSTSGRIMLNLTPLLLEVHASLEGTKAVLLLLVTACHYGCYGNLYFTLLVSPV